MYDPAHDAALDAAVARWLARPPVGHLPPRPVLDRAGAGYTHPLLTRLLPGASGEAAADFDAAGPPAEARDG